MNRKYNYKKYITKKGIEYIAPKEIVDSLLNAGFKIYLCGRTGYKSLQVFEKNNITKRVHYIGMLAHFIVDVDWDEYITFKDKNFLNLRVSNLKINKYN